MKHYNVAAERTRIGMTQEQLASELGCTVKTLGKWEKDISTMPGKTLSDVASIFSCSVDYLLDKTEERKELHV
ncbi:MAG: helix-turn-helix transcriptional regulator [Eggerthellaceae bacterium]|nr:helix-turn-helix transcriptional regulator [Eggerthellaceae bacterium]